MHSTARKHAGYRPHSSWRYHGASAMTQLGMAASTIGLALEQVTLAMGALASGLAVVGCTKSEPQPATPRTEPNVAVSAATAPEPAARTDGFTSQNTPPSADTASNDAPVDIAPRSGWPSALTASTSGAHTPPATAAEPGGPAAGGEHTQITGCLAHASTAQSPTRSLGSTGTNAETWRVTALGTNVVVTHTLQHACCLQGYATATVSAGTITIEELLTGQPCRCLCESTIQTRVPVPAGEYDVQSVTVTNGQRRIVHAQRITVGPKPRH